MDTALSQLSVIHFEAPLKRILLICGILASLLYVCSDILAAIIWEDYSYTAQSVSELRAIGAPTRPLLVPILVYYTQFELAFGCGVRLVAGTNRALRISGTLIISLGIIDLAGPLFPMHLRGTEGTFIDSMHITITIITVLLILLIIGFGSGTKGRLFRIYSVITILILIGSGIWAFLDAPGIAENLPAPWMGVRERINIYGYMYGSSYLPMSF